MAKCKLPCLKEVTDGQELSPDGKQKISDGQKEVVNVSDGEICTVD
jgi:hypothetical protein